MEERRIENIEQTHNDTNNTEEEVTYTEKVIRAFTSIFFAFPLLVENYFNKKDYSSLVDIYNPSSRYYLRRVAEARKAAEEAKALAEQNASLTN